MWSYVLVVTGICNSLNLVTICVNQFCSHRLRIGFSWTHECHCLCLEPIVAVSGGEFPMCVTRRSLLKGIDSSVDIFEESYQVLGWFWGQYIFFNKIRGVELAKLLGWSSVSQQRGHNLQNATDQSSLSLLDPKIYFFNLSYCKLHIYECKE